MAYVSFEGSLAKVLTETEPIHATVIVVSD